jgi:ribonuclease HII
MCFDQFLSQLYRPMLKPFYVDGKLEAGCDEAGRGCLAGPVYAAAVILPADFYHPLLNDSKKLREKDRDQLRVVIEKEAVDYAVARVDAPEIDRINILRASFRAMHLALGQLSRKPKLILVDGNRFTPFGQVPYQTIIRGDGIYASIAAASILAKTYRDDFMKSLDAVCPQYLWKENKGYPTAAHRKAILLYGLSHYHRRSFQCLPEPPALPI